MTSVALVKDGISIIAVYDGAIPSPIWMDGDPLSGLTVGGPAVGEFALLPVTYTDTPPSGQVQTGWNFASAAIAGGAVSMSRFWQTVTPTVPSSCTRSQGLLALLASGVTNPITTIQTAINAISDPTQQMTANIKFQAANWYRADPFIASLGTALNLTSAQIDALFIAAQNY